MSSQLLANMHAVVVGARVNEKLESIGWGTARALGAHGAAVTVVCRSAEALAEVRPQAFETGMDDPLQCDVTSDESLATLAEELAKRQPIDIFVHAVAGGVDRRNLAGTLIDNMPREIFASASDVSAYSFFALAQLLRARFVETGASLIGMTYGSPDQVENGYNVMGVAKSELATITRYLARDFGPAGHRVNLIAAGAVKTRSGLAIKGLSDLLEYTPKVAPLRRNTSAEAVGNVAAFLGSDLSRDVTGTIIPVDCGMHMMGPFALLPTLLEELKQARVPVPELSRH